MRDVIARRFPVLMVMALMLLCLSPLMAVRDFTPANELRYLSIADEAIAQGHVFAFTNQGEPYADKPPLYIWIIMLCKLLLGHHSMYVLSLFSLIPLFVILWTMDRWITGVPGSGFSPLRRFSAALMLGTMGLFLGMSVFLRMDMMMVMWIVLSMYAFYRGRPGLFAVFTFLALFTKGPVGLLCPVLSVLVILLSEKSCKELGRFLGWKTWGIIALGCMVWFTGVYIDGGKPYLENLLVHQTVGRAVNSFHHKAPMWYYLIQIWPNTAPYCLALVPALVLSFARRRGRSLAEKVMALTVVVTFVMLSCFSSKISIYLAPVFPFLAYILPLYAERQGYARWIRWSLDAASSIVAALLGAALIIIVALFDRIDLLAPYAAAKSPLTIVAGAILLAGGVVGLIVSRRGWEHSVAVVGTSMLAAALTLSALLPQFNGYLGYGELCSLIPEGKAVYTWRVYRPENVDVYLGRDIVDLNVEHKEKAPGEVLSLVPDDAVFVTATKRFPDGIPGRTRLQSGDYSVFVPEP